MGNEKTNREDIYRFSRELATVICGRIKVFKQQAPQETRPKKRNSVDRAQNQLAPKEKKNTQKARTA